MLTLGIILLAIVVLCVVVARFSRIGKTVVLYGVLILVAAIILFPFYEMFVLSTATTTQIYSFPPVTWFQGNLLNNIVSMNEAVSFGRAFLNSCIVSFSSTGLVLFFCSLGGYAFAVYRFPGQGKLFALLLGTMMVPWTAGIIPWFFMMSSFGWINNFLALIVPGAANAFGIFWMRQYCTNNVPTTLVEAAKIDGCSEWTIFFRVIAPILTPAYAALGIMQFVNTWNDFMQPMLILRTERMQTLPLMLRTMIGDRSTDYGALMLASTCAVLPLLIAFLSASKRFISGLTAGAIKE